MVLSFHDRARALRPQLVERRRDLHRHPELAYQEFRTAEIVARTLTDLGLEVQTGVGRTGVVGLLDGDKDGPTLLIRADMDALPIIEENRTEYVSETPGVMHACGHDGHTAILLTVARMLTEQREHLEGRIKFVFQPAEEGMGGAATMITDGVLRSPRPDYTIGLHLWNEMPVGTVASTPGPFMAGGEFFEVEISGVGGHGAQPHRTQDPVAAAAQIITALQSVVSRNINPLDSAVVTVARMRAGDAFNVIPQSASIGGTIRYFEDAVRDLVHERVAALCEGIAAGMGCSARVDFQSGIIPVRNDPALSDRVAEVATGIVGAGNVMRGFRTMASEDMALLMDDIPGCYFFVGSANASRELDFPHHHPRFDIDEDALVVGAAVLAETAASLLMRNS